MNESFELQGVCASQIDIELDGNSVKSVNFHGGCPGNLLGITKLVQGRDIDEVISLLEGTICGSKETSCPDQFAKALKVIKENEKRVVMTSQPAGII